MKLKLDENLGHAVDDFFGKPDTTWNLPVARGLSGAADDQIIAACARERRCLITLDSEFGNPLVFKPWEYVGIAVLHLPAKPSHEDLMIACRTLVRALEKGSITGKLWSVQRGRIREYRPNLPEQP